MGRRLKDFVMQSLLECRTSRPGSALLEGSSNQGWLYIGNNADTSCQTSLLQSMQPIGFLQQPPWLHSCMLVGFCNRNQAA